MQSCGDEFAGLYRYRLWRVWQRDLPLLVMIMLNPSTATATDNDPTVARCEGRARREGFGGLVVLNIFAMVATNPKKMKAAEDPVGDRNDRTLTEAFSGQWLRELSQANEPHTFCAAWGSHGGHRGRARQVRKLAGQHGVGLVCLDRTKKGHPRHPLYVKNEQAFLSLDG